jgi:hypothetical protein
MLCFDGVTHFYGADATGAPLPNTTGSCYSTLGCLPRLCALNAEPGVAWVFFSATADNVTAGGSVMAGGAVLAMLLLSLVLNLVFLGVLICMRRPTPQPIPGVAIIEMERVPSDDESLEGLDG